MDNLVLGRIVVLGSSIGTFVVPDTCFALALGLEVLSSCFALLTVRGSCLLSYLLLLHLLGVRAGCGSLASEDLLQTTYDHLLLGLVCHWNALGVW